MAQKNWNLRHARMSFIARLFDWIRNEFSDADIRTDNQKERIAEMWPIFEPWLLAIKKPKCR
ncbi:hypothetical protein SAMN04488115_109158 [Bosea lathyri]|uniref:Uncharacterized protein n=1 Tax=Bosea lathyri TaxID=1036778 RepID=A0A1H6C9V2_9HYPH|nr:hypothetical protein SAMN04488115_109158 [Bosea lathyri]